MARWIKRTCDESVKELAYKRKVSRKNLKAKYQAFCNREIAKVNSKRKHKLDTSRQRLDNKRKRRIDNQIRSYEWKPIKLQKPLVSQLKQKLLRILQEYVRYRDTDKHGLGHCITCWCLLHLTRTIEGRSANGGHCLESKVNASAFDERNINLQCNSCNMKQSQGDMQTIEEHKRAIDKKYGQGTFNSIYLAFKRRTTLSVTWLQERILVWTKKLDKERSKKRLL